MSKIIDVKGQPVSSGQESEPDALERATAMFEQAIRDPQTRGRLSMQLAKLVQQLGLLPLDSWKRLLAADDAFTDEFNRILRETQALDAEAKVDMEAKRELARKCVRVFIKIKPALTEAMRAEEVDGRFIVP
jgi:hypothetical protein